MTKLAKLTCPLAILAALSFASTPAKAQFGGMDEAQMQQFAPMLEMMKKQMGKQRFGEMMKMMGPMMMQMQGQGGFGGGFGGFGGGGMPGGFDMGQMMSMMSPMGSLMGGGGHRGKIRRHRIWALRADAFGVPDGRPRGRRPFLIPARFVRPNVPRPRNTAESIVVN